MRKTMIVTLTASLLFAFQGMAVAETGVDTADLFKKNCKICHKLDKRGMGPAIQKMTKDTVILTEALTNGRKSMPSFSKKLSGEEINAMVDYLLTLQKK